jgi:hypothetical protein
MKKILLFSLSICTISALPLVAHRHHKEVIVVQEPLVVGQPVVIDATYAVIESEPPAEIIETPSPSPGNTYYWQKGYWKWENGWKWKTGVWVVRPTSQAIWVPGCWVKHHHRHGWYWVEGHWQ